VYFPQIKDKFCVFSLRDKFHPAYYLGTLNLMPHLLNFIPQIISIWKTSFLVLSAYTEVFLKSNTHSAYYQNTLLHSAYNLYALNFIPCIISIREISFRVFSNLPKRNLNIQNYFFFFIDFIGILYQKRSEAKLLDLNPNRNVLLYCSSMELTQNDF
jgi:hypothetical protein